MKYLLLISLLVGTTAVFSQSKKKQIERLQYQLDSIELVNDTIFHEIGQLYNEIDDCRIGYNELNIERDASNELQKIVTYELKISSELREKDRLKIRSKEIVIDSLRDQVSELKAKLAPPRKPSKETPNHTNNPFANGGNGGGNEITYGDGPSRAKPRRRLNDVHIENIPLANDAKIFFTLTINPAGKVISYKMKPHTNTLNQALIDKIGRAIIKQVRYSSKDSFGTEEVHYNVYLKSIE
ncbi:MAG: hypothetical protein ACI837_002816 [Crocinitomicaceae bacterium]|jgi:hypothetical protein